MIYLELDKDKKVIFDEFSAIEGRNSEGYNDKDLKLLVFLLMNLERNMLQPLFRTISPNHKVSIIEAIIDYEKLESKLKNTLLKSRVIDFRDLSHTKKENEILLVSQHGQLAKINGTIQEKLINIYETMTDFEKTYITKTLAEKEGKYGQISSHITRMVDNNK